MILAAFYISFHLTTVTYSFCFELLEIRKKCSDFKGNVQSNALKIKATDSEFCLSYKVAEYEHIYEFQNIFTIAKVILIILVTKAWPKIEVPMLPNRSRLESEPLCQYIFY